MLQLLMHMEKILIKKRKKTKRGKNNLHVIFMLKDIQNLRKMQNPLI